MKKILEEFIPFEHKDLKYINTSLNLARQQKKSETLEGMMASNVIYTNLVEYLSRNLLVNLQHMFFLLSYKILNGIFFIKDKEEGKQIPKMLGQLIGTLRNYEFPDSLDFISTLEKFSQIRNSVFHSLLTISEEEMKKGKIDNQLTEIQETAEVILDKYNSITAGISLSWASLVSQAAQQYEPQTEKENENKLPLEINENKKAQKKS